MKKIILTFIMFSFLFGFIGLEAKKRKFEEFKYPNLNKITIHEVAKIELENGIKLRVLEDKTLPVVDMKIYLKGGTIFDPKGKKGLSSFCCSLLRIGGTKDIKSQDMDFLLESGAIKISFSAYTDMIVVSVSSLKDKFPQAISILSKMLKEPAFDKEKLEEIKVRSRNEIARKNDSASSILGREFTKVIYGENSPLNNDSSYDDIDNITIDDIKQYYSTFIKPSNMIAGISGDITVDKIKELFSKELSSWKLDDSKVPDYPVVKSNDFGAKVAFIEKSDQNQTQISIGHIGERWNAEKAASIKVFNQILCGGLDSRLFTRVRTKMGLTYGIGGGIITKYLYPGVTIFKTFTKTESTFKVIKAVFDELEKIKKEKVTAEELKLAKEAFANSYVFKFYPVEKCLWSQLYDEFYSIDPDFDKKMLEAVAKVTPEDVLNVAKDYLHPEKMVIMIVGKEKDLDGKLSELGTVKKIDISIKEPTVKEVIPPATKENLKKGKSLIANLFKGKYKAYKNFKSMITDMTMSMKAPNGMDLTVDTVRYLALPDKLAMDMNINNMMKMSVRRNGKVEEMEQMGQVKSKTIEDDWTDFGELYDLAKNIDKYNCQYIKEHEENGKKYDLIYLFGKDKKQKKWQKIYINKKTGFVEIKESMQAMMGPKKLIKTYLSDFKTFNKIPFATKLKLQSLGKDIGNITVKSFKVNEKIPESHFTLKSKK